MTRILAVLVAAFVGFGLIACGDDDGGSTTSDAGRTDGGTGGTDSGMSGMDAGVCAAPAPGAIGGTCDSDSDCGSSGFCVDEEEEWPSQGFCTRECTSDTECGSNGVCAHLDTGEGGPDGGVPDAGLPDGGATGGGGDGPPPFLCFPKCCDGDLCSAGQLCTNRMQGQITLDKFACLPGKSDAKDGDACASSGDCNVNSGCRVDLEMPGGYCITFGCTMGDDTTCAPGGDGSCISPEPDFSVCVDTCTTDSDCRESEGYACAAFGPTMACLHASVGDACTVDADCGVTPWVCKTGTDFPGGYCTVDCDPGSGDCGEESFCYDPDSGTANDDYCVGSCGGNEDCRTPDYYCAAIGDQSGCLLE